MLVIVRGLPGSGKSTIVNAAVKSLGSAPIILDPDTADYSSEDYQELAAKLESEGVESKFFPHRFLRGQAEQGIDSNSTIIWTQAFTLLGGLQRTIQHLVEYAQSQSKNLKIMLVEVSVDPAVAQERVRERVSSGGYDVSEDRFKKFIAEYRSFAEDLGLEALELNSVESVESNSIKLAQMINDSRS